MIQRALDDMLDQLEELPQWKERDNSVLKKKFKDKFKEIFSEFEDPTKGDKILKAIKKTEDIQKKAYKNLRDVIQQNQDLENLEETTEKLREGAIVFKKDTKKVENHMVWENRKWMLFIVLIVVALGGFVWFKFF